MNCLNSLIIEGSVSSEFITNENKVPNGAFSVSVPRFTVSKDGEKNEEISVFNVCVYGSNYVECCKKNISLNRGIRVVGRLKEVRSTDENGILNSKVVVVAEHIEFKPKFNK